MPADTTIRGCVGDCRGGVRARVSARDGTQDDGAGDRRVGAGSGDDARAAEHARPWPRHTGHAAEFRVARSRGRTARADRARYLRPLLRVVAARRLERRLRPSVGARTTGTWRGAFACSGTAPRVRAAPGRRRSPPPPAPCTSAVASKPSARVPARTSSGPTTGSASSRSANCAGRWTPVRAPDPPRRDAVPDRGHGRHRVLRRGDATR